jgi:hypothetical protein
MKKEVVNLQNENFKRIKKIQEWLTKEMEKKDLETSINVLWDIEFLLDEIKRRDEILNKFRQAAFFEKPDL